MKPCPVCPGGRLHHQDGIMVGCTVCHTMAYAAAWEALPRVSPDAERLVDAFEDACTSVRARSANRGTHMQTYVEKLRGIRACKGAVEWAQTQHSPQAAWDACERGDWMLWLCGRLSGEPGSDARKTLTLAACQCARLSLRFVAGDEHRPEQAICAANQWALGDASLTLEDVRASAAAAAAYASAYAAYATAAAYASAYAASADSAARPRVLRECAAIVRRFYPDVPVIP